MTRAGGRIQRIVGMAALAVVSELLPAHAAAVEGTWVSSYYHTADAGTENALRTNLDLRTPAYLPGGTLLTLRASLVYYRVDSRYGLESFEGDILRHRYFADLQKSAVRMRGQFVPWQRIDTGAGRSRERLAQIDLNVASPQAPSLGIHYYRSDREVPLRVDAASPMGRSSSDDWRGELSYGRGGVSTDLAYRRLQTTPASGSLGARSLTDEWRGGMRAAGTWRDLSLQSGYEGTYSTYSQRARERVLYRQRVDAGTFWNPSRRFTLGGSGSVQWGRNEDNALQADQALVEKFMSTSADYRPLDGLIVRMLREYREEQQGSRTLVADYLRGQVSFQRDLFRGLVMQTGFQNSIDLRSRGGQIPANSVFAILDGAVRRGLAARAEIRAIRAAIADRTGTQWMRSAQLRTAPTYNTTVQVSWRRDTLPRFEERAQTDQEWSYLVGYRPVSAVDFTGSYRHLSGAGRLTRQERHGSAMVGIRLTESSTLSVDWSRREALVVSSRSGETALGMDFGFRLPDEVRARLSWRRISRRVLGYPFEYKQASNTYGLLLDKSF